MFRVIGHLENEIGIWEEIQEIIYDTKAHRYNHSIINVWRIDTTKAPRRFIMLNFKKKALSEFVVLLLVLQVLSIPSRIISSSHFNKT